MKYSTVGSIKKEILPQIHEGVGRSGRQIPNVPQGFNFFQEEDEYSQFLQKNDPLKRWVDVEEITILEEVFDKKYWEKICPGDEFNDDELNDEFGLEDKTENENSSFIEVELTPENSGFIASVCYDGEFVFIIREPSGSIVVEEIENGVKISNISKFEDLPKFGSGYESIKIKSDIDYHKEGRKIFLSNKRSESKKQISQKRNIRKTRKDIQKYGGFWDPYKLDIDDILGDHTEADEEFLKNSVYIPLNKLFEEEFLAKMIK